MISLLLPTRDRPESLKRFISSANETATKPIEIVCYIDEDDDSYDKLIASIRVVRGPRIILSEMWNKCYEQASGDILGHMGDDIIFRTPGWDKLVEKAFPEDKIAFVYGDDGDPNHKSFGTHGFIHRKWAETVGYFVPPYFSSDHNDTWLNDVAEALGRKIKIPIYTEHMHPAFGKGPLDKTHKERIARGKRDKVGEVYYSKEMAVKRQADVDKLRKVMQ